MSQHTNRLSNHLSIGHTHTSRPAGKEGPPIELTRDNPYIYVCTFILCALINEGEEGAEVYENATVLTCWFNDTMPVT